MAGIVGPRLRTPDLENYKHATIFGLQPVLAIVTLDSAYFIPGMVPTVLVFADGTRSENEWQNSGAWRLLY